MQDSWLSKKADEIQSFAYRKDMKKFFDALKTIYGPQSSETTPLLNADGTSLLTDKEAIVKKWAEHFDGVLNRPSSINGEAINRLPQLECNPLLDELPTVSETVKSIKKKGKRKVQGVPQSHKKNVREKCRECHNHKPQPFPDPKRKRKPNKHKTNKRTKSTKISSLFPKRGNRNTKRTEKHKNKMTHGKTYNKSPRRKNHKATKSKTNTGTTAALPRPLSSGKAPGSDAIPAEVYKAGGPQVAEKLTELFHIMWRKEAIPKEFKDATIIHLFKRKGNPQVCDNHRGISLLSIAGRIIVRVLLNRLNKHLEQSGLLPESQCGFRKDRGTIDMIFTARPLQEKCQEQNVDLYMTFVDLTKAFDTVSREGLWKIMVKFMSCQIHSNGAAVP